MGTTTTRRARLLAGWLILALILAGCQSSYQYHWEYFWQSIFQPDSLIINGLWLTIGISIISQVIGVVLGTFAAMGKLARLLPVRLLAGFYVWLFRGTPLVVQIVFFYFGLSATGIYRWPDIDLFGLIIAGKVQAGIFALGVNEGAYMAEIVRAGILSIDAGQMEAAKSLGMRYGLAMRRIVLPQAARVIVPPLGNEFNNMLKTTSLLVLISVSELYFVFNTKQGQKFAPFEYFLAAAIWYLLLTTIWGLIQARIERRLARGVAGAPPPGPSLRARLLGMRRESIDDPSVLSGGR